MKKLIAILLSLSLLTACGVTSGETTVPTAPTVTEPMETTAVPPETTVPAPTVNESLGPCFGNMDLPQLQDWSYDFAREHCLDHIPDFSPERGPHTDVTPYLYWAYAHQPAEEGVEMIEMTREYVDEMVLTYFGFLPDQHEKNVGDSYAWDYDIERQVFFQHFVTLAYPSFFLLQSMEYTDGIYTVHAIRYTTRFLPSDEAEDLRMKTDLLEGDTSKLIAASNVTVSFRMDPESLEPLFCAYDDASLFYPP